MDYLWQTYDGFKSRLAHVRHLIYYYYGYQEHELRLMYPSRYINPRLVAVKSNDFDTIQSKVLTGEWKVNDCVSLNNMTTMLHEAVVMDRQDVFDFLLRQGADPNTRDRNGYTPLLKAAALGRVHMLKQLLALGINPFQRDPYGSTPLQKALLHEEWQAVEVLERYRNPTHSPSKWLWGPEI